MKALHPIRWVPMTDHWRENALCAGPAGESIDWVPTPQKRRGGISKETRANVAAAKAVCAQCPVQAECLREALREPFTAGIWGATTAADRRGLHTPDRPSLAACGTDSGYTRHRNRHEGACELCKKAHAEATRERAQRAAAPVVFSAHHEEGKHSGYTELEGYFG